MKARFTRKSINLDEVKHNTALIKDAVPYQIEKTIELEPSEYEAFTRRLLDDYDFIAQNLDHQYVDKAGCWHCLLIISQGKNEGLLIQSEGYAYARYAAYVADTSVLAADQPTGLTA